MVRPIRFTVRLSSKEIASIGDYAMNEHMPLSVAVRELLALALRGLKINGRDVRQNVADRGIGVG